jgi:hypothetical protein
MKKNKACIPPSFLAKADEGTVQYAFDHADNFTLLSNALKKNKRVVFLSTMHSEKKRETRILEKKKQMYFTTRKKVVWTVMIKCAACTPRQEKQTVGQLGSFME